MKIVRSVILFIILFLGFSLTSFADKIEEKVETEWYVKIIESNLDNKELDQNIKVWGEIKYDLSDIEKKLLKNYNLKVEFEWSLKWTTTKKWSIFKRKFSDFWKKEINLNIYTLKDKEKKLILDKKFHIFVYKNKMPIIFDKNIWEERIEKYIDKSIESGIYVSKDLVINLEDNKKIDLWKYINNNFELIPEKWNYVTIWWDEKFIFTVIWRINKEFILDWKSINTNLVLVSPFSTDFLDNYLRNLLSGKKWIKNIILIPESSISQLRLNPDNVYNLEKSLNNKEYENLKVNTEEKISNFLFISKFINTLLNNGFLMSSIYLIIIIPFLFTFIWIFKHFIWLSPIWTIIPIFIALQLFILWILPTLIILLLLILFNLSVSKIVNKYTLLYTPKISFIIIMNLAVLMFSINLFYDYNLININISDIIFIVLFIVIAERLITLVISKEFNEYKFNLLNTIIFSLVSYFFLSISTINTVILAYPELILALIPINFMIWRFTWLRITEYFRFREVIKNIEE